MRKLLSIGPAVLVALCSVSLATANPLPCDNCSCSHSCSQSCLGGGGTTTCGAVGICSGSSACGGGGCLTSGDTQAFLALAGVEIRWPAGEVAIRSLDASHIELALDRTGEGLSERRLVLTTAVPIGSFAAHGRAQVVVAGKQLLVLAPAGKALARISDLEDRVAEDQPAVLQLGFTHLAEYRDRSGRIRLDALQTVDSPLTGPLPQPNPYPDPGCASACSVSCRSPESSCSVNCAAFGNLCAECNCLPTTGASCVCQDPG